MTTEKSKVKKSKGNPLWDEVFKDEVLTADISHLPEHFQLAINHERKCVAFRLKQVENYLARLKLVLAGKDYLDTFENLKPAHGVGFPKERYIEMRTKWDKEQDMKKKKKNVK